MKDTNSQNLFDHELLPAHKLVGMELENGWTVVEFYKRQPLATGGFFSVGYTAKNKDGRDAFLKAIDLSEAQRSSDPTGALEALTRTFNCERDLLLKCKEKNFDKVVRALDHGSVLVDGVAVPYLVFEMADGDIRAHLDFAETLDIAWCLRMLHDVTVGLKQLHSAGIAHQDLKPSNVLVFKGLIAKLADLGRSSHNEIEVPHNALNIPGGTQYAAPELKYGFIHPDFQRRRMGADLFLLGNIVVFVFTGQTMSTLMLSHLDTDHLPMKINYAEAVPYLQKGFNESIDAIESEIPEPVRAEIIRMVRELCEPDLLKRGDPRAGGSLSLERYVNAFNVLAYKAERKLFAFPSKQA